MYSEHLNALNANSLTQQKFSFINAAGNDATNRFNDVLGKGSFDIIYCDIVIIRSDVVSAGFTAGRSFSEA